jgi:Flp pilus assembly protein TadD
VTRGRRGAILVVLVALAAALPALLPGFIHDDHHLIEDNELIRSLARAGEILGRGYWTVGGAAVPNLYRPVTILSFAINYAAGGVHPLGYRAVNLALHLGVVLLVLALARRVLGAPRPGVFPDGALVAALLFAVHPVHTEVLGLVVGRGDLLAAAGTLAAVLLFLAGRERAAAGDRRGALARDALAVLAFVLGVFSKENAIAAPLIVLAADLTRPWHPAAPGGAKGPRPRPAWGVHAVFLGAAVAAVVARTAVLGVVGPAAFTHFVDNPIAHQAFPQSTFTALAVLARYAGLMVFPARLSIDHSYDVIPAAGSLFETGPAIGAILLLGGAATMLLAWRRRPAVAFSLALAGLALAPVANLLIPIGTIMAERLLYLPSAGVCLLAGAGAAALGSVGESAGKRTLAATALVVVGLGVRSFDRLLDWRDDRTIFASAVAVTPRSVRAQFNYGAASERAGDDGAAAAAYGTALAIWPDFADAHFNLAGVEARRRRWPEALDHYREAVRLQPGNVSYLVNLGSSLTSAGRAADAIAPLQRAVELDPKSDRAWNNLGAAWLALDHADDAVRAWREARTLDPANPDYAVNLAMALDAQGDVAGAVGEWGRAVALRPAEPIVRYRLGRALEKAGRATEAAEAYRASIALAPASPVPQRALGLLLLRSGDKAGARAALEQAAVLDHGGGVMDDEARRALESLRTRAAGP